MGDKRADRHRDAICGAAPAGAREAMALTATVTPMPIGVPTTRRANDDIVSHSRSCETITADMAAQTASGSANNVASS